MMMMIIIFTVIMIKSRKMRMT